MTQDDDVHVAGHHGATSNGHTTAADMRPDSLGDVCDDMRRRVDRLLAEESTTPLLRGVQEQLRTSMKTVQEALERYSLDQIAISYNGGKDCLVLLVMILACLARRRSTATNPSTDKFQAVYIVSPDPFAEVDEFVESSAAQYSLDISRYSLSMKAGLEKYLSDRPGVKAIFVGTRRTDPHGEKLTHFDPTDSGWPSFMRIHPVIDWHYAEIWTFIRQIGVSYCPLYDQGYTSLGGTKDTLPNPHLKRDAGEAGFRPAYELMGDSEERLGRDK